MLLIGHLQVRVEGDDVIVAAPAGELKVWKRTPRVGSCSAADSRLFVIIGGGKWRCSSD
jgi:hypothetical protein